DLHERVVEDDPSHDDEERNRNRQKNDPTHGVASLGVRHAVCPPVVSQNEPVDLRTWIASEHDAVLTRFEQSVTSVVPLERWIDSAGDGGSSIAWLAFHTAYHEDVAVNAVLGGGRPLLDDWRAGLGIDGVPTDVGLGEAEQVVLTEQINVDRLVPYL